MLTPCMCKKLAQKAGFFVVCTLENVKQNQM
nr:MAG TPA: hypothetical protein [Bacteriophage sp.]